ncbi:MAG: sulfatase [Bdellovibrionales bacterium]|nr:sulfatase [Bdellovibrionales bacterium]
MHLKQHLKIAARYGLMTGLIWGMADSSAKIALKNFEWFEIYQAITIPALFFLFLFEAIAVVLHLCLSKERRGEASFEFNYFLVGGGVLFLLFSEILINSFVLTAQSFWSGQNLELNAYVFVAILAAWIPMSAWLRKKKELIVDFSIRTKALVNNILFAASVFVGVSLTYDLYSIFSIPSLIARSPLRSKDQLVPPNIVLIVLDTLRADQLTAYGNKLSLSPNLDAFAANSVVFKNAYSTSSWTLPSHASMFTGKYIFRHGAHQSHQKLIDSHDTLAEILGRQGYITAGFTGAGYTKVKFGIGQGFQYYDDRLDFHEYKYSQTDLSLLKILDFISPEMRRIIFRSDGEKTALQTTPRIAKWFSKNPSRPFFLFINYFDVHNPYNLGQEYQNIRASSDLDLMKINQILEFDYRFHSRSSSNNLVSDHIKHQIRALYDSELTFLDQQIQKLFSVMKSHNAWENSVIIVTSDHGEEFFEHGGALHKQTLYEEVLRVPLMIHFPKTFEPRQIDNPVSTLDIFATVLDLVGVSDYSRYDSVSLEPLLLGKGEYTRSYLLAQLYGRPALLEPSQRALIEDNWKLLEVAPESGEIPNGLYQLQFDPTEQHNRIEQHLAKRERLKTLADSLVSNWEVK